MRYIFLIVFLVIAYLSVQLFYSYVDETVSKNLDELYVNKKRYTEANVNIFERMLYRLALKKFPNASNCSVLSEGNNSAPIAIKWSDMRNSYQLKVCLFQISKAVANPYDLYLLLEGQGFNVEFYDESSSSFGVTSITAQWRVEINGRYSPFSAISTFYVSENSPFVSGPLRIRLVFDKENRLVEQHITYYTF